MEKPLITDAMRSAREDIPYCAPSDGEGMLLQPDSISLKTSDEAILAPLVRAARAGIKVVAAFGGSWLVTRIERNVNKRSTVYLQRLVNVDAPAPAPRTEDQSFLIEAAMQLGFVTTNDEGDAFACTEDQLLEFAKRIQDAAGIKCFHCGATFHSEAAAREHFGNTPDETALCLELTALMPVQIIQRVREAERHTNEAVADRMAAEGREEYAQGQLASLGSYFKGATTVRDAWNLHDSMTGRALAAEAALAQLPAEMVQMARAAAERNAARPVLPDNTLETYIPCPGRGGRCRAKKCLDAGFCSP